MRKSAKAKISFTTLFAASATILAIILAGCAGVLNPAGYFKADPQIKKFLTEYPDADLTFTHYSAEESINEFANIQKICGKELKTGKELYKAEINDKASGLNVVAYLDVETQLMECVRKFGAEEARSDQGNIKPSQDDAKQDLAFCKKLSVCEKATLEINSGKTGDAYSFSVLGLNKEACSVELSVKETQNLKQLEGSSVACMQEWSKKFEKIANFDGKTCKRYIDLLIKNTLNHAADEKSAICQGELRERLLKK